MADDANLMTLEHDDGTPATPPPEAPAAPEPAASPEPQAAAPAEPEPAPDPKTAGLLKELRETRERERQWRQTAEAGMTLAQRLQANPRALAVLQGQDAPASADPAPPATPIAPKHELDALARQHLWFKADGQPDTDMAAQFLALVDQRAATIAEHAVARHLGPLQQGLTRDKATGRRAEAMDVAAKLNIPSETAAPIIDGILQTNPELLADPQTAAMAIVAAAGLHYINSRTGPPSAGAPPAPQAGPSRPVPTFVEQGTGNVPQSPAMSALEQRLAKRAGISPKVWQESVGRMATTQVSRTGLRTFSSEEDS